MLTSFWTAHSSLLTNYKKIVPLHFQTLIRKYHKKHRKMAKVLIIGAGGVGSVVAHKCASVPEVFTEIMLASRTKAKCDAIAAQIGGNRIQTAQVDADNVRKPSVCLKATNQIC